MREGERRREKSSDGRGAGDIVHEGELSEDSAGVVGLDGRGAAVDLVEVDLAGVGRGEEARRGEARMR